MTFSIVARCPRTGQVGVGALTAMAGVGKLVAHVNVDAGAVATQATINPFLAYDGLSMLSDGRSPRAVIDALLTEDPGRETRQVGMVDRQGRVHAFTGSEAPGWAGHFVGQGLAVQGNRLVGPETLEEAVRAFEQNDQLDLAERLLCAIEAGEHTGGDRDGAQSATVSVIGAEPYPLWDLRVDDAEDPAEELRRLYGIFQEQMVPLIEKLPTRADPMGQAARELLSSGRGASVPGE